MTIVTSSSTANTQSSERSSIGSKDLSTSKLSPTPASTNWTKMKNCWPELDFWQSEHWISAQRKLDGEILRHGRFNPGQSSLFECLIRVPLSDVRVAIFGQDPYPSRGFATGSAFAVPSSVPAESFPPTLKAIFREYEADLHYILPTRGDLTEWERQGVLLWNVFPTTQEDKSLAHQWSEWVHLTEEIIKRLQQKGIVFVFLGAKARSFVPEGIYDDSGNSVIELAHPSPLAAGAKDPFRGSRLFSRINAELNSHAIEPIDWKLP